MKTTLLALAYLAALAYASATGSLLAIALMSLPGGVLLLALCKAASRPMPRPPLRRPYDYTERI